MKDSSTWVDIQTTPSVWHYSQSTLINFPGNKKGKHPQIISHSKLAPYKDMGIFKYNRKSQYQELIRHSRQSKE